MENLIVIGHPDKKSFCYNGIMKTIIETLKKNNQTYELIDLYADKFSPSRYYRNEKIVKKYQDLVAKSKKIYIISPVWWFRCTPLIEGFFDQVFAQGFAYVFVPITKIYAYPKPLLGDKKVRTYLTHGAPSIPVLTLYLNSVKLRLVMGVYSFVFGWFKTKTRQFWSVPFVDLNKRIKYLRRVEKDVLSDIKK
jgi:putative NADPH-quinone reductase|tara:strand:- start:605 stop:1183 length:579 start_codon:yes stop_codon:yes gene_type:complete